MSIRSMLGFLDFAWFKEQYKVGNERMIFRRLCLLSLIYLNLTSRLWYPPITFLLTILQPSLRLYRQHAERLPCSPHFSIYTGLDSNLVPRPATTAILLATPPARGSRLAAAQRHANWIPSQKKSLASRVLSRVPPLAVSITREALR
jgi:hypothetical protein